MKMQISFDLIDLKHALQIATEVAPYCDILEVGTILIYHYGLTSINAFKEAFPNKTILADTKILDRGTQAIPLFAQTNVHWVTVMAGTSKNVIHATCNAAHKLNKKVMLDLLDSAALGQSAMEAKDLGADALLFHEPYDQQESLIFLDRWELIKGNTQLPIFVSGHITKENIQQIISVQPDGIIIGSSITDASNPAEQAKYFYNLIHAI